MEEQNIRERLINLFLSGEGVNLELAFELEASTGLDLSDFWLGLEASYFLQNNAKRLIVPNQKPQDHKLQLLKAYKDSRDATYKTWRFIRVFHFNTYYFQLNSPLHFQPDNPLFDYVREVNFKGYEHPPLEKMGWLKAFKCLEVLSYINHPLKPLDIYNWLQDLLPHFPKLRCLELPNCGLEAIPPAVFSLQYLEKLHLPGNKIRQIPAALANMPSLRSITLGNNPIENWAEGFETFRQLPQLKWVSFISQWRYRLAATGGYEWLKINSDTHLSADKMPLLRTFFTFFSKLKNLQIRACRLQEFPDFLIETIPHLEHLSLSVNHLSSLPDNISELKSLKHLNLSNNNFAQLPDCLRQMTHLEMLDISYNPLKKLPEWLSELKQLKFLHLNNTQIEQLPDSMRHLKHLEVLRMRHNQLTELPDWLLDLLELKKLDVTDNQIPKISENIDKMQVLEELHLSENPLVIIPKNIAQMPSLKNLYLAYMTEMNWGQVFSVLEQAIQQNEPLSALEQAIQQKKPLMAYWLSGKAPIIQCGMKNNELVRQISPAYMRSISFSKQGRGFGAGNPALFHKVLLSLRGVTTIRQLSLSVLSLMKKDIEALITLKQIEKLEFDRCPAQTFTNDYNLIAEMQQLKELSFLSCKLMHIPAFVSQLQQLERLDLSYNYLPADTSFDFIENLSHLEYVNIRGIKSSVPPVFWKVKRPFKLVMNKYYITETDKNRAKEQLFLDLEMV